MNGTLTTYENNSMSLSCHGTLTVVDGVIISISYKGFPRSYGIDGWLDFYKHKCMGAPVSADEIERIVGFGGRSNIISTFTSN